jgi:hypothetical protein
MSYFGLKSQIFLKNVELVIKYLKLKGRQKSLEGRMRPAGRTLAMSVLYHQHTSFRTLYPFGKADMKT